jgi:hypothetical protein
MPGPSEFMVGNAPGGANYGGRLLDFPGLRNLGADYYAGQAARRANDAATAFPNGIPTIGGKPLSEGGQPDTNAILDTGTRTMGLPFLQGLLPFLMEPPRRSAPGYNTGEATPGPDSPHPGGTGSAHLTPPTAGPKTTTIAELASRMGGDPEDAHLATIAKPFGIDVDTPLSAVPPTLVKALRDYYHPGDSDRGSEIPDTPGDHAEAAAGGPRVGAAPTGAATEPGAPAPWSSKGHAAAAFGDVAGAPGPIATPPPRPLKTITVRPPGAPPPVAAPAAPGRTTAPVAGPDERLAPNVNRGRYKTNADANNAAVRDLNSRIDEQTDFASRVSRLNPQRGEQEFKVLDNLKSQRDKIVDFQGKERDLTEPEKLARSTGARNPIEYETQKKTNEYYEKVIGGYTGQANISASSMKEIQLSRSLLNMPDMYTGTGEGLVLGWKRAVAMAANTSIGRAIGLDPADPAPQEAFRKVMASAVLKQVDDLKATAGQMGEQQGRFFQSQIELMQKAAQNPDNSLVANRMLTEISYRSAQHAIETANAVADMAERYKASHNGLLDHGFNQVLTNWLIEHPAFTDKEMSNPKILGAPSIPPAIKTPEQLDTWATNIGLRPNDPMRTPHGGIKYWVTDAARTRYPLSGR